MAQMDPTKLTAPKLRLQERLAAIYLGVFPARHGHRFFRHLVHHLPIVIGLSLAVALAAHLGWFQGFQTMALDTLLLAQGSRRSDQVVIVTIGDEEFRSRKLFNDTSPLDPEKIGQILSAIAAEEPRIIAVDLDTSSTSPALAGKYRELAEATATKGWPPVIWSCDGEEVSDPHEGHGAPKLDIEHPALSGHHSAINGLITLPCDVDGVVRRYFRTFPVKNGGHHDSLPWAVVKRYCQDKVAHNEELPQHLQELFDEKFTVHKRNELYMNYPGDRFSFNHIPAQAVLNPAVWEKQKQNVRGKIVLLGGTYLAARDIHPTPVGRKSGVEVLAMAVESELQGAGISKLHEAFAILIDILFGTLLVYFSWRFVSPHAMLLNLLAVGVLAVAASYITFNTFGYWLNFAVVLVGIWLHNQLDLFREIPSLRRENDDLRHKLSNYEQAGASHSQGSSAPAAISAAVTTGHTPEQAQ